jgi:RimJ/RimL family protein N-acetyltransferase
MQNKPKYVIRTIYRKDLDTFADYESELYKERATDINFWQVVEEKAPSKKVLKEWFTKLCKSAYSRDTVTRVIEIDGKIVGLCTVMRQGKWRETSHVGDLGIDILKEYRRQGLGSALIAETIKESRKRFEIIECSAFSTNKPAIRLYRKFGFRKCGVWPKHIKRDKRYIDSVLMYLKTVTNPSSKSRKTARN